MWVQPSNQRKAQGMRHRTPDNAFTLEDALHQRMHCIENVWHQKPFTNFYRACGYLPVLVENHCQHTLLPPFSSPGPSTTKNHWSRGITQ
jgi:hypothetical protein